MLSKHCDCGGQIIWDLNTSLVEEEGGKVSIGCTGFCQDCEKEYPGEITGIVISELLRPTDKLSYALDIIEDEKFQTMEAIKDSGLPNGYKDKLKKSVDEAYDPVTKALKEVIYCEFEPEPIIEISDDEAKVIIDNRKRRGLFIVDNGDGTFTGIDNRQGDAWTEDRISRYSCEKWLRDMEVDEDA